MTALAGIDPMALKSLIATNEANRKTIETLKQKLINLSGGSGVIILQSHRLRIRVIQYTGAFRINAWCDNEKNWFWKDKSLDDRDVKLPIDYNKVFEDARNAHSLQNMPPMIPGPNPFTLYPPALLAWMNSRDIFANAYQQAVEAAFSSYLATAAIIPTPKDNDAVDLQSQLLTLGDHIITVRITPVARDRVNRWAFRGELISLSADNTVERIKEFDVDSSEYPNQAMQSPLPDISLQITVQKDQ